MKNVWKILGLTALAIGIVAAYCGYRIGLGKPFTLTELANRQAFLLLVENPELFTQIGIIDAVVLDNGAVPLTLLDKLVDEWIAQTKGA